MPISIFRLAAPGLAVALAALGLGTAPASADMMRACTSEIGQFCEGVPRGRGRIAACLYAHLDNIGGNCAAEVEDVASSGSIALFVPSSVTELQGTEYETQLRSACSTDAQSLCPLVRSSNERVLACLYARERQLTSGCKDTGERVLRELR